MAYPHIVTSLDALALPEDQPVRLAIGMFDGVHLGHQAVLGAAKKSAEQAGAMFGVLTFSPHPSRILRPDKAVPLVMPAQEKHLFLQELGAELIINHTFTLDFAKVPAESFITMLKEHIPGLQAIYIGEQFRFGQGRSGDVTLLVELGKQCGIDVFSVERIQLDGEAISSTRIREALNLGCMEDVNTMLGYAYFSQGSLHCDETLCSLYFSWDPELKPMTGSYVGRIISKDFPGNPEVLICYEADKGLLNMHLLDSVDPFTFKGHARVEWLALIAPHMPTADTLEPLKNQASQWLHKPI